MAWGDDIKILRPQMFINLDNIRTCVFGHVDKKFSIVFIKVLGKIVYQFFYIFLNFA